MKYTEEIYSTLSHGGFISSNSLSPAVRRYYDAIEEELTDYYEYYKGIGFYLESGNGYYFFARKESKADIDRKLEAAEMPDSKTLARSYPMISMFLFMKRFNATFDVINPPPKA